MHPVRPLRRSTFWAAYSVARRSRWATQNLNGACTVSSQNRHIPRERAWRLCGVTVGHKGVLCFRRARLPAHAAGRSSYRFCRRTRRGARSALARRGELNCAGSRISPKSNSWCAPTLSLGRARGHPRQRPMANRETTHENQGHPVQRQFCRPSKHTPARTFGPAVEMVVLAVPYRARAMRPSCQSSSRQFAASVQLP